ncbi:MAG: methyltransferase [Nitrososphaerota archaeon]|nr:methyltransferase [Nitrososphaerota archaeon]
MKVARHREGKTILFVPKESVTVVPPPTSPVFFNPAASLNRDVTVSVAAASGGSKFCDAMAGVGARGVRVANEVDGVSEVTMVDFNHEALRLAKRSAAANGVSGKCTFAEAETTSFLFSRFGRDMRYGSVDLDPFGTPIRQMHAALSATADGGILSLTATDTAVLCGVHLSTCSRRYGSVPLNNDFHHETGLRILLGSLARYAAAVDVGIEPQAAHSTKHYLRVFVKVIPGASVADASLRELGSVAWCPGCGDVRMSLGHEGACRVCRRKVKVAGPLWAGSIAKEPLVESAKKAALERGLGGAAEVLGSLDGVNGFPPWSFDIDKICSALKVPTVSELSVYNALTKGGHRVMRTPFEKTGVKTDATRAEVVEAVRSASANPAGGPRVSAPRNSSRARS